MSHNRRFMMIFSSASYKKKKEMKKINRILKTYEKQILKL